MPRYLTKEEELALEPTHIFTTETTISNWECAHEIEAGKICSAGNTISNSQCRNGACGQRRKGGAYALDNNGKRIGRFSDADHVRFWPYDTQGPA
jgi:Zn-dependent metalloprotease